jgi:hypothetical protein
MCPKIFNRGALDFLAQYSIVTRHGLMIGMTVVMASKLIVHYLMRWLLRARDVPDGYQ